VVDGDGEDVVDLGRVPGRLLQVQEVEEVHHGVDGLLGVDLELGGRLG
jgi:hypothetical protein